MTESDGLRQIRNRILGRRVIAVESGGARLVLNDGTTLDLYMSDNDCCAAADGSWVIKPDALDAIITDVRFTENHRNYDGEMTTNYMTITILHNQNPVALANCYANNGNGGFYASTLSLIVSHKLGRTKHDFTVEVVSA